VVKHLNGSLAEQWEEARPLLQMSVPFDLDESVAAVFRVGSHSHGTYVPPEDPTGIDDVDLMIVCVPPPRYVLGMVRWEHAQYKHGKLDVVFYDWGKWLRMVSKSNPNVVGTMWLEDEDMYLPNYSDTVNDLLDSRDLFLSKRMYPSFVGYAKGQLYKMTHFVHEGYMGDKRKRLVEQFGYDVKNAAHLLRLMRMACEVIEDPRKLIVRRPDAAELIAIKRGEWSKEQVIEEAERLFARADAAMLTTGLRDDPDDTLLQRFMEAGYMEWHTWE
jgi:predicted nucleotidyltransferase